MSYVLATDEREVLELLGDPDVRLVSGATDWYASAMGASQRYKLVDISRVADLHGVVELPHWLRIGAATTWSEIVRSALPASASGLKDAAGLIGSSQIQNRATIGGNLCNGSPAADGVTALLAMDAEVELKSLSGTRRISVSGFLKGKNQVDLRPGEMLNNVWVPVPASPSASAFVKFGNRQRLNISTASIAVRLTMPRDRARCEYAIAAGSVAPTPVRLHTLEAALANADAQNAETLPGTADIPEIVPIDDIRASAAYRTRIVRPLIQQALELASGRLEHA
jgi:CO/xanthine dehydrogenase FAD-binding subunit